MPVCLCVLTDNETCDHGAPNSSRCKKSHDQETFEPGHEGARRSECDLHDAADKQRRFTAESDQRNCNGASDDMGTEEQGEVKLSLCHEGVVGLEV
jgi:hypothetical protein